MSRVGMGAQAQVEGGHFGMIWNVCSARQRGVLVTVRGSEMGVGRRNGGIEGYGEGRTGKVIHTEQHKICNGRRHRKRMKGDQHSPTCIIRSNLDER